MRVLCVLLLCGLGACARQESIDTAQMLPHASTLLRCVENADLCANGYARFSDERGVKRVVLITSDLDTSTTDPYRMPVGYIRRMVEWDLPVFASRFDWIVVPGNHEAMRTLRDAKKVYEQQLKAHST